MRRLLIAIVLMTLATLSSAAQSEKDLAYLHEVKTPISKMNPVDRHEILHRLQIVASQLRAEAITINGQQSFFVQAQSGLGSTFCGNVNCSLWIFDSNHRMILNSFSESIGYLPTTHHGRNDVLIARHGSATEQSVLRYEFDGTRYRRTRCAFVVYGDSDGKVYDPPHITVKACSSM